MIKSITYEEIIKLLRNTVIENSGVDSTKVFNALSARGTDLSDVISSTETYSYSMSNVFILFELLKNEGGDNYITPKDDNNMLAITSYTYHLMIYGNGSDLCSEYLRATFKQPSIAMNLRDEGIYIKTVSSGETINEFINNTLLLRNDINVSLEVVYELKNATEQEYFNYENLYGDNVELIIKKV